MKKVLLTWVAGMLALTGQAQHAYLSAPGVAVFYPAKAVGTLYEDARDGFEYRDGHFARYELKAETVGKQVNVSIRKVEGKDEAKPRVLRVGYVTDQKITYSPWTAGESVSMKVVKDKTDALVLKGLKFVEPEKKEFNFRK